MKSSIQHQRHWLDIAEIAAVVGSVGSVVAGVFYQQLLWATVPLSASATFALLSRQRLQSAIDNKQQASEVLIQENKTKLVDLTKQTIESERKHQSSITELESEIGQVRNLAVTELAKLQQETKADFNSATGELQQLQTSLTKLTNLNQDLQQNLDTLEAKQQETNRIVRELKAIDIFTQNINAELNTVQSYFERGLAYQRLGNKHRAIDDFSKTVELDPNHPQAYYHRGLLYRELGIDRKAVIDLRRASQLYFDRGDLDKYRETRDLGQEVHQDTVTDIVENEQHSEQVIVGNLFG